MIGRTRGVPLASRPPPRTRRRRCWGRTDARAGEARAGEGEGSDKRGCRIEQGVRGWSCTWAIKGRGRVGLKGCDKITGCEGGSDEGIREWLYYVV